MSHGIRSRTREPHVYMCTRCGRWNLMLFPHGRADYASIEGSVSLEDTIGPPIHVDLPRPPTVQGGYAIVAHRVPMVQELRSGVLISFNGIVQAVAHPLRSTCSSAVIRTGRSWSEERGDAHIAICGDAQCTASNLVEWCLHKLFTRGWPLSKLAPIDYEIVEAAYRLDGELGAAGAIIGMIAEAKTVPRFWNPKLMLTMWARIEVDDK